MDLRAEQFGVLDEPLRDTRLQWMNPPPYAAVTRASLVVRPSGGTDFWQRTHYGFQADSGHFLSVDVPFDFECFADVRFHPVHQYDQAGLMVRVSADCWLKTSVEYEPDGPSRLGAVVTNGGFSDWSTQDFPSAIDAVGLRIVRRGQELLVHARTADGAPWTQIRLCRLAESRPDGSVSAGIYACCPKEAGFQAEFRRFELRRLSAPDPN